MKRYIHERFFMDRAEAQYFPTYKAQAVTFELAAPSFPDIESLGMASMVQVRHTMCSKQDAFCRAEAHKALAAKPFQTIRVLDLPAYMGKVVAEAQGRGHVQTVELAGADQRWRQRDHERHYAWVWKYFV